MLIKRPHEAETMNLKLRPEVLIGIGIGPIRETVLACISASLAGAAHLHMARLSKIALDVALLSV